MHWFIKLSSSFLKVKICKKLILSKYEKGEDSSKIFRHLNDALCLRMVKRWCKRLYRTVYIVKLFIISFERRSRLKNKKSKEKSDQAIALNNSRTSVCWILKNDLLLRTSKKIVQPPLTDEKKRCTEAFLTREDAMKILFSDEKLFDLDVIYSSQNDCIRAVSRVEADQWGAVKQERTFLEKAMV